MIAAGPVPLRAFPLVEPPPGLAGSPARLAGNNGPVMAIDELLERLASTTPGVRRVAVLDLIRLSAHEPRAIGALLNHLPAETDEKAAISIIRHLAAARHQDAKPVLWQLYEDPGTPVRIAHAAIVAHDELAGLRMDAWRPPQ